MKILHVVGETKILKLERRPSVKSEGKYPTRLEKFLKLLQTFRTLFLKNCQLINSVMVALFPNYSKPVLQFLDVNIGRLDE